MKKISIMLFAMLISTSIFASTQYSLFINGERVNSDIIVKDGVTYVPLRVVSDEIGAKIDIYNNEIYVTASIKKDVDEGITVIEKDDYLIKDAKKYLNATVFMRDGKIIISYNNGIEEIVKNRKELKDKVDVERQKVADENLRRAQQAAEKMKNAQ